MKRKIKKHAPSKPRYKRKKREQKVKFRKRYAASVLQRGAQKALSFAKVAALSTLILVGGLAGWKFWNESEILRLVEVTYQGDIPGGLSKFLNFEAGQNLLTMKLRQKEAESLARFPELESLTIRRGLDRTLSVTGAYKTPLALYGPKGQGWAIGSQGTPFPISIQMVGDPSRFPIAFPRQNAASMGKFLKDIKNNHPGFYDELKTLKTDRMGKTQLTMRDETILEWGFILPEETTVKVEKWKTIRNRFQAEKGAVAQFVEPSRIILNRNWKQQ